jgi:hypothetical protein
MNKKTMWFGTGLLIMIGLLMIIGMITDAWTNGPTDFKIKFEIDEETQNFIDEQNNIKTCNVTVAQSSVKQSDGIPIKWNAFLDLNNYQIIGDLEYEIVGANIEYREILFSINGKRIHLGKGEEFVFMKQKLTVNDMFITDIPTLDASAMVTIEKVLEDD